MRAPTALACLALMARGALAVHFAYYLWYGNPEHDGSYRHWDHKVLPHWSPATRARFPHGQPHSPPEDIHSAYYPMRGCYSSRDRATLVEQMREMRDYGGSAAVVSWWGRPDHPGTADSQGINTDEALLPVLDAAAEAGIGVAIHLEPYPGRSTASLRDDLAYLSDRYGAHPALLRDARHQTVYYVYDSYHIAPEEWAELLCADGGRSVRGTPQDGHFVGLWLHQGHGTDLVRGCFDGFYTYFASDGFSYGSTTRNWATMVAFARREGLASYLSVGPGYNDEKIRPWNAANTKDREGGEYYRRMWRAALAAGPDDVTITSYNEWGESTAVEPAVPRVAQLSDGSERRYQDYGPYSPHFYLELTREFAAELQGGRQDAVRAGGVGGHEEL